MILLFTERQSRSNIVLSDIPPCPDNLNINNMESQEKDRSTQRKVTILQHGKL